MGWGQVAFFVGSFLLKTLLKKPEKAQPAKDRGAGAEFRAQNSSYGVPINRLWGTMRVSGNVIWMAPVQNISGSYYASFAVGICAGEMLSIMRIWADNELVYNKRGAGSGYVGLTGLKFTFFSGSETQEISSYILANTDGATDIPAFRGLCYVLFEDFPLEKFYNQVPHIEFEVSTDAEIGLNYVELRDSITAGDPADRDHIIYYPDKTFFLIASGGYFYRMTTIGTYLQFGILYPDSNNLYGPDFDIGENSVVYTSVYINTSYRKIALLDEFTLTETATFGTFTTAVEYLRVSQSAAHPYLITIIAGEENLVVWPRDGAGSDFIEIARLIFGIPGTAYDNYYLWKAVCHIPNSGSFLVVSAEEGHYYDPPDDITIDYDQSVVSRLEVFSLTSHVITHSVIPAATIEKADDICYDPETDTIILASSSQSKIAFIDYATMVPYAETITFSSGEGADKLYTKSAFRRGVVDGFLYLVTYTATSGTPIISKIDIANREVAFSWTLNDSDVTPVTSAGGSAYDSLTDSVVLVSPYGSSDWVKVLLDRADRTTVTLSSIITDICELSGLAAEEIDVTELEEDGVSGYILAGGGVTGREAIEPLSKAYFFDAVDSGGVLKFMKRGAVAELDIPEADLGAVTSRSGDNSEKLVITRAHEQDIPSRMRVTYLDPDFNYEQNSQSAIRPSSRSLSKEISDLTLAVALDADGAKQIAVKAIGQFAVERTVYKFSVTREYYALDPNDVITITMEDGLVHTVRITQIEYAGSAMNITAVAQKAATYESSAAGVTTTRPETQIPFIGQTILVIVDCSLISSVNNVTGLYVAVFGYTDAWSGANVYRSTDGVTYPGSALLSTDKDAIVGKAVSVLADVDDPWVWDDGNQVSIQLLDTSDSLSSASKLNVLNGSNIAALGDEIIQWKTATLEANGTYTLSGLLRGRKGSDWACGSHAAGEYFVLLNSDYISFVQLPADDLAVTRYYRAVSIGSKAPGAEQAIVAAFNNMKPLSVQRVTGARDGSSNLTISWIRRTRFGGEWADGGDVAIGETSESYSIDIYDGSTVVRTLTSITQSVVYSAALQTTDFGSPQSAVDVTVYQISSVIGRGFETEATI